MSDAARTLQPAAVRQREQRAPRGRRTLVGLEMTTGVTGLAGGLLLVVVPGGSLLHANPRALAGTPFGDWRVPGVLLAVLVGGGFLLTGWWQWRDHWHARELSIFAGIGLIAFEAAELAWIGFQPLQALFTVVGLAIIGLARSTKLNQPRRGRWQMVSELAGVLHDLPAFLTAPLYRRWHLHWGATPAEATASLPGDTLLPQAQYRTTRAITIDAPPDAVWPWLVQVGCGRGGFYSNDLLDNLGRPSATTIVASLQQLEPGQWVPMSPGSPTERTAFKVDSFEVRQVAAVDQTGQHLGVAAERDRRRRYPPGDPHPRRVRLAEPAAGNAGRAPDGIRRLRHAAQDAARHQGPGRVPPPGTSSRTGTSIKGLSRAALFDRQGRHGPVRCRC